MGRQGGESYTCQVQDGAVQRRLPVVDLLSQDEIALESVCYDILKAEFTRDKHTETYPQMVGVDDHLYQAADSAFWLAGVRYDPENDGTPIGSLGVHEHGNNSTEMEYSRNFGAGNGIELIELNPVASAADVVTGVPRVYSLEQNYPNPFNPSTVISYRLPASSHVTLKVYDISGRDVAVLVDAERAAGRYTVTWNASDIPSGAYFYRLTSGGFVETKKMLLVR